MISYLYRCWRIGRQFLLAKSLGWGLFVRGPGVLPKFTIERCAMMFLLIGIYTSTAYAQSDVTRGMDGSYSTTFSYTIEPKEKLKFVTMVTMPKLDETGYYLYVDVPGETLKELVPEPTKELFTHWLQNNQFYAWKQNTLRYAKKNHLEFQKFDSEKRIIWFIHEDLAKQIRAKRQKEAAKMDKNPFMNQEVSGPNGKPK